jgi:NAD(P)H-dependent FMN reductase
MALKLLAFAASLRAASWNRKLIGVAADIARREGAEVRLAEFSEFDMPLYNADLQAHGMPEGTQRLAQAIQEADGILLASPEYNYSVPGTLKNAIDWVSRIRPGIFRNRSALLLSASNGQFGGIRGLWQLRIPLEGCSVHVYPDMYALPWAEKQFDVNGELVEPDRKERLERLIGAYLKTAVALSEVVA